MRFWLSPSSDVSLREQLVTQIRLGIVSGDLAAGQKLPSTRELARRFHIHPNTVSAAYRELHRGGWVGFRKGSGMYVHQLDDEAGHAGSHQLDHLIAQFFSAARQNGYSPADIRKNLSQWLDLQPPDHLLVIEPDVELRRILMAEIEAATGVRVVGSGFDDLQVSMFNGATPVSLYNHARKMRAILRPGVEWLPLHSTSIAGRLKAEQTPAPDVMLVVASGWPGFLERARAVLIAAGIDPDALDLRDARRPDWKKGLGPGSVVITDPLVAARLPAGCISRVFRFISDASLSELRAHVTPRLVIEES